LMTTIPRSKGGGYEEFAPFYDGFTAGSDYEAWTVQILALLDSHGWSGQRVLDVACGTGNSFVPLLRRGFSVTGCDVSPAMLAEAARKAPDVELIEADVRELPNLGPFDLVTCFDDSSNYLLDQEELTSALRSMAASLGGDGLLLFDLNTLLAYRTTFATSSVVERDGVAFIWRGDGRPDLASGCRAAAHLDVFAPEDGELYRRVSSVHEQRHFPPELVIALIGAAGLDCAGAYGVLDDGTFVGEPDETHHPKALYAARLAKGGDSE
jgi:SAM-dependent methyltransferase